MEKNPFSQPEIHLKVDTNGPLDFFFPLAMLDEPTFFLVPYFREGQAEFSSPSQAVRKHCKVRVGDEDWAMLQLGWQQKGEGRIRMIGGWFQRLILIFHLHFFEDISIG